MRLTENKVVYKCDLCGSNYTSWEDIVHHVRRHYGDYPYRCTSCGFAGVSKGSLELHMFDENHQKSIFLKQRGNHELFMKPKLKPETGMESRARESMIPQIRPSIYPNAFKNDPQTQDDPAIRLQYARIQAAYGQNGIHSYPQSGGIPPLAHFQHLHTGCEKIQPLNLNGSSSLQPRFDSHSQKVQSRASPPPKLQKSQQLLHPARKLKVLSPKPVQTITTVKVAKIEEPVACSTPVKKEPLKLTPPKTPEPSKTKLVIVPQSKCCLKSLLLMRSRSCCSRLISRFVIGFQRINESGIKTRKTKVRRQKRLSKSRVH